MKNKKKRNVKNLKINTRIVLTTVLAIVIPIIIIASFSSVFVHNVSSYFSLSAVTTNSYSTVNQIRWAQTMWSITTQLTNDEGGTEQKKENIDTLVKPLTKIGTKIYIEQNGELFYTSDSGCDIIACANEIVDMDTQHNINYFADNGLVIISHTDDYMLLIVNDEYTTNNSDERPNIRSIMNLILSRTGIAVLVIIMLFAAAIGVISFITSKTIVKPIKKIAQGADEIARGNLDYTIDYDSTNELGQTVNSFNDMRLRLKESIDKQTAAEEERRVLVAGIAHDLRTPLTSARGYAEGLIDGIADTDEKRTKYLETICQSINETERILDDLLTVSRLELNGYEMNLSDVAVQEFFNDGVAEIKERLEAVDFDFESRCNCSENAAISIDPDRFARVIENIISNSIKYAREDVKGKIVFTLSEYERSIIMEITDNGIGVDKESLPRIFDTMYRADPARTAVADGSGLGLSICRQIVSLHGGSIWATSRQRNGLSMFISLPKKEMSSNEQNFDN